MSSRTSAAAASAKKNAGGSASSASTATSPSSKPRSTSPLATLIDNYRLETPVKLKMVDAFLIFLMISGAMQFFYAILITSFPFNSFIAGFASTVGQFILAASLRIQANSANSSVFPTISPERAFGDFLFRQLTAAPLALQWHESHV